MLSEKEKMLSGKLYDPTDSELAKLRLKAHKLSKDYNDTYEDEEKKRFEILKELLGEVNEGVYLQGPIQFDYGVFTKFGKNFYANFNFTVLDCCPVNIGDDVFIGANVSIMPPIHSMLPEERNLRKRENKEVYDLEYAAPVNIGSNCWLGSNVVVCGGVNIGEGCVIGAGSVVTKDIPRGVFAAGNPCRVIREITEKDSVKYKKHLW